MARTHCRQLDIAYVDGIDPGVAMHIEQVQGGLPVSGKALRRLGELAAAAPERERPAGVGMRGAECTQR